MNRTPLEVSSRDIKHPIICYRCSISGAFGTMHRCVSMNRHTTITNTGAPQGCVISPVLFILYTNDCVSQNSDCMTVKFADDAALIGLIKDSENYYRDEVTNFVQWCDNNYLQLNVSKTKELIIDFRNKKDVIIPIEIKNENVEIVKQYKYLGTIMDEKLHWGPNTEFIFKKCQQRLYFMRKLRSFNVNTRVMLLFYRCFIESVLTFSMQCWYGSLTLKSKCSLNKIILMATKLSGVSVSDLQSLFDSRVLNLAERILSDPTHILFSEYKLLPSGRRYQMPRFKTNRIQNSFLPSSIRLLNE